MNILYRKIYTNERAVKALSRHSSIFEMFCPNFFTFAIGIMAAEVKTGSGVGDVINEYIDLENSVL